MVDRHLLEKRMKEINKLERSIRITPTNLIRVSTICDHLVCHVYAVFC